MTKITAQQRANKKQNEKRQGAAQTFSSVRFKDAESLANINRIIKATGKTKEAALIAAFNALDEVISKN